MGLDRKYSQCPLYKNRLAFLRKITVTNLGVAATNLMGDQSPDEK